MNLKIITKERAIGLWNKNKEVFFIDDHGFEAVIYDIGTFEHWDTFGIERKPNFATNLKQLVGSIKVCDICSKMINHLNNYSDSEFEVFDSPFDKFGKNWNICENCWDNGEVYEYFERCDSCGRYIRLNNGYRKYFRVYNDDSIICVGCLQEQWFENGMKNFKDADFFNYSDLEKHGFIKYRSFFCQSKESYNKAEEHFKALQYSGNLVIVNIDSSGMGLEHHLSLYIKTSIDKEFVINDWITMRLENNQTNIYIDGNLFNQCKFLLMNIPNTYDDTNETFEYKSIDELSQKYSKDLEQNSKAYEITPEEEFKAHCSNIQAWVDNDYNPELLHSSLSLPILKILAEKDIKIFHSLIYHLDSMWNDYKTKERRELLHNTYYHLIKDCMKQYKLKLCDISGSVFLSMLKFIEMTDLFVANIHRIKYYYKATSRGVRQDSEKTEFSRLRKKQIKKAKRRNYYYRKKYFPNRQERDFVMALWNQEISPISDEIDYPAYLWSKRHNDWCKFKRMSEYHKKDIKIKQIYLDKGYEYYYLLDDSVYLVSGGYSSNSYSFADCFIKKTDGNIIRDYILI